MGYNSKYTNEERAKAIRISNIPYRIKHKLNEIKELRLERERLIKELNGKFNGEI